MRMAEIEGEHRRAMELAVVDKTFGESTRGQYCALVVALSGIGGAIYLGTLGMQWAASIVGGASLAVIVLAFLKAKASEPEPPPPPVPVNRKAKKK